VEAVANWLTFGIDRQQDSYRTTPLCYVQGMLIQICQTSSYLWTTIIAFNLFMVVVKHKPMRSYELYYHVTIWIMVIVVTSLPLTTKSYGLGDQNYWCWIKNNNLMGNVWRFVTFYFPLYFCIALVIIMYMVIFRAIRKTFKSMPLKGGTNYSEKEKQRVKLILGRLKLYPIVFVILWIFPIINRIHNWVSHDEVFILFLMHVLTAPLAGFVNSIVYGLDPPMRERYAALLASKGLCVGCLGTQQSQQVAVDGEQIEDDDDSSGSGEVQEPFK